MAQYDCLLLDYMVEKLGIKKDKVVELSNLLYKNYGTTMAGPRAVGYDFDYDDFHRYVHGRLPYENLKPDPSLKSLLQTLPLKKITLNPTHKNTVSGDEEDIEFLGSAATTTYVHTSPQIFDMMDQFAHRNQGTTLPKTPICKPQESAIERALNIAKINPQRTLFFDDSVRNIQAGKHVGLHTVLIGTSQRPKGADYELESIHNIK
ncbi:hypothetical protein ES332_D13G121300v1 [Gossypium tomentosum]|uniref:Uncharacterized protein n=1 Tax=Gossypium tomentosum TaxID=34277 RepID=A0A5D2HVK5_GOSTO|nr:hypothetical protein ES332_D13G121300v1 [Gossypium tomentosum]